MLADAPIFGMIFAVCHAAHPEPWTLWNECHQARLGIEGKPMWEGRVAYLKGFKMAHPEGASGEIKDIIARETKKLNARRAELEPIHARDRAEAGNLPGLHGQGAGARAGTPTPGRGRARRCGTAAAGGGRQAQQHDHRSNEASSHRRESNEVGVRAH